MAYYWTCPYCGANNDPGEACDCQKEKKEATPDVAGMTSGTRPTLSVTTGQDNVKVKEVHYDR